VGAFERKGTVAKEVMKEVVEVAAKEAAKVVVREIHTITAKEEV
jgi:hypothetical protein